MVSKSIRVKLLLTQWPLRAHEPMIAVTKACTSELTLFAYLRLSFKNYHHYLKDIGIRHAKKILPKGNHMKALNVFQF